MIPNLKLTTLPYGGRSRPVGKKPPHEQAPHEYLENVRNNDLFRRKNRALCALSFEFSRIRVIPPPYAPRSNRRFANLFFGTFFFLAKKKVHRSPFIKGKSFRKIPFAHKEKRNRSPFQRDFRENPVRRYKQI
jgi:hypothetical protein